MADKITTRVTFRAQRNLINEMVDFKAELDDTITNGGRILIAQAPVIRKFDGGDAPWENVDFYGKITVVIGDTGHQVYKATSAMRVRVNEIEVKNDLDQVITPAIGQTLYIQIDRHELITSRLFITPEGPTSNIKTPSGKAEMVDSVFGDIQYITKFIFDGTYWNLMEISGEGGPNKALHRIRGNTFTLSAGGGNRTINWGIVTQAETYRDLESTDALAYTITDIVGETSDCKRIAIRITSDNITLQHNSNLWQSEGADIETKLGDVIEYIYDSASDVWKCVGLSRAISIGKIRALYTGFSGASVVAGGAWQVTTSVDGSEVYMDSPITKLSTYGFALPEGRYARMWIAGVMAATDGNCAVRLVNDSGGLFFDPDISQSKFTKSSASFSAESPPFLVTSDNQISWAFRNKSTATFTISYLACEVL